MNWKKSICLVTLINRVNERFEVATTFPATEG